MIKTTLYIFTRKQFFSLEKVCKAKCIQNEGECQTKVQALRGEFITPFPTHAFTFHFIGLTFVKIIKRRASVFDFL